MSQERNILGLSDETIEAMKEYLKHQDQYDCLILINRLAGMKFTKEIFRSILDYIHKNSKNPAEKAEKLCELIAYLGDNPKTRIQEWIIMNRDEDEDE